MPTETPSLQSLAACAVPPAERAARAAELAALGYTEEFTGDIEPLPPYLVRGPTAEEMAQVVEMQRLLEAEGNPVAAIPRGYWEANHFESRASLFNRYVVANDGHVKHAKVCVYVYGEGHGGMVRVGGRVVCVVVCMWGWDQQASLAVRLERASDAASSHCRSFTNHPNPSNPKPTDWQDMLMADIAWRDETKMLELQRLTREAVTGVPDAVFTQVRTS